MGRLMFVRESFGGFMSKSWLHVITTVSVHLCGLHAGAIHIYSGVYLFYANDVCIYFAGFFANLFKQGCCECG